MASIDQLVSDIQKLFEGKDLSERIHNLVGNLGNSFVSRFLEYAEERQSTLRLSMIGKPLRQIWYELQNYPKEPLSAETKFKYLFGDVLENLVLFLAIEAGYPIKDQQKEVELDGVIGHIDCTCFDWIIDCKSASSFSFRKFESGSIRSDDHFGYIGQMAGYSESLGGLPGAFLVIDKQLGKLCLCKFSAEELARYRARDKIQQIRSSLANDQPPERCYEDKPEGKSGNRILSVGCSYCGYRETCWSDANDGQGLKTYLYANGPKHFTAIVKEPRVQALEEFPIKEDA